MIDPTRLARAIHLDAQRQADGTITVHGHVVTGDNCDCRDHEVRSGWCKHRLTVALAVLDGEVLAALRQLVPQPRARGTG